MPASESAPSVPSHEESGPNGGDLETSSPVQLLPTPTTKAGFQFNQLNVQ